MEGIKEQLLHAYTIQQSIAQLHVLYTVEDFDDRSIRYQSVRQRYIDSDVIAIGAPYSPERMAQVESLMAQDKRPGTAEEMCGVQEGKRMRLSIDRCVNQGQTSYKRLLLTLLCLIQPAQ
jgi:hypothetical protein